MSAEASQNFTSARACASSILGAIELQGLENTRRATHRIRERCAQFLRRQRVQRWPRHALGTQQGQPVGAASARFDPLEPRDRHVAIVNDDGVPGPDLAQVGAQIVLQF